MVCSEISACVGMQLAVARSPRPSAVEARSQTAPRLCAQGADTEHRPGAPGRRPDGDTCTPARSGPSEQQAAQVSSLTAHQVPGAQATCSELQGGPVPGVPAWAPRRSPVPEGSRPRLRVPRA